MVITREHANGKSCYAIDGENVSRGELEVRCGKYLSVYGLQSLINRLNYQNRAVIEIDGAYVYAGLREMYAEDELKYARSEIKRLEKKIAEIQKTCDN